MGAHIIAPARAFQRIPAPPSRHASFRRREFTGLYPFFPIPRLMDFSFLRAGGLRPANARPVSRPHAPVWPMLRAASAAAQAASPTAQAVAGVLRGQDQEGDWIQDLAEIFAPRTSGMIAAARPTGSFNPLIAQHLGVGQ
ncbi:hypothetical protein K663_00800 [Sphingobium sp. MI1205]|nr:hypothetical protein K663_00800 [Sphingobium sp. MI1205]